MPQTFTVPSHAYSVGTTPFGPFTVSSGSQIKVTLTRENWPDSAGVEIISIEADISFDNGATWQLLTQFGSAGGTLSLDKNGQPRTTSWLTCAITTPCQIKGRVILAQPLQTAITIAIT